MRGVLIGAGFFAGFHAEAWRRTPGAALVGVADLDAARARAFAERHGVAESSDDVEDLLHRLRPDFVDLATRPDVRLPIVALAARLQIPVLCQKPLADTWQQARRLVGLCEEAGTRLIVHENWRFQPWFRECARLVQDGAVGQPLVVSFRMRTGDGRGEQPYAVQPYFRTMKRFLIHETCVHFIDTFRFLMGEIVEVSCRVARFNPRITGEDATWIHLCFSSGARGHIDANRLTGPHPAPVAFGETRIEGESGTLRIDGEGRIWIGGAGGAPESLHSWSAPAEGYKGDSVRAFQEHAIAALRGGAPAETEGNDYLNSVAAVFACYRSAEENRVVSPGEIWDT